MPPPNSPNNKNNNKSPKSKDISNNIMENKDKNVDNTVDKNENASFSDIIDKILQKYSIPPINNKNIKENLNNTPLDTCKEKKSLYNNSVNTENNENTNENTNETDDNNDKTSNSSFLPNINTSTPSSIFDYPRPNTPPLIVRKSKLYKNNRTKNHIKNDLSNNIILPTINRTTLGKNNESDKVNITDNVNNKEDNIKNNPLHLSKRHIDMKIKELLDKIKKARDDVENSTKESENIIMNLNRSSTTPKVVTHDSDKKTTTTLKKPQSVDLSYNKYSTTITPYTSNYKRPTYLSKYNVDTINSNILNRYNKYFDSNSYTNPRNSYNFDKNKSSSFFEPFYKQRLQSVYNTPLPKHVRPSPPIVEKKKVNISVSIDGLADLLKLIDDYPMQYDIEYNINMRAIHNIKEPLEDLNTMIGMNKLKDSIVDQIIYFVQDLHVSKKKDDGDFMHTCIYGPPGTGKTEVAKIMGRIYSKLGILKKNVFKKVTRADLIAGYLGQTAMKTRDMVKDCLGGVMFIDEAYALGNREKRDSFAKECIDTLCESLSDHKHDLMVIIAGYEDELKKCFFSYNDGLESRFTWRFKTDDYKANELRQIFVKKVNEAGWSIKKDNIKDEWFENNMDYFKYYGRDMETLFSKVKIAHSRRVFCLDETEKKMITNKDLEKGFSHYLENDNIKARKEDKEREARIFRSMYS